ncbi:hypothetical protein Lbir_0685, partial [Legionella birminghamensis]
AVVGAGGAVVGAGGRWSQPRGFEGLRREFGNISCKSIKNIGYKLLNWLNCGRHVLLLY